MITKELLKNYANKLMFEMDEVEYDTLLSEFDVILKQMDLIGNINGISDVEPMSFPFELTDVNLRDDVSNNSICFDDMKINVSEYEDNMVRIPKVIE